MGLAEAGGMNFVRELFAPDRSRCGAGDRACRIALAVAACNNLAFLATGWALKGLPLSKAGPINLSGGTDQAGFLKSGLQCIC